MRFTINDAQDIREEAVRDILEALRQEEGKEINVEDIDLSNGSEAPIVMYVDAVISQAIKDKASDIHFEPFEKEFRIRYRVDGALYEMPPPPLSLAAAIISRIKILSNLDISERRIPQDGRIQKRYAGRPVDLRVSCLPTTHGESVVLRVLDRTVGSRSQQFALIVFILIQKRAVSLGKQPRQIFRFVPVHGDTVVEYQYFARIRLRPRRASVAGTLAIIAFVGQFC